MSKTITLDIAALTEISHYAHWIPANKGLTDKWMAEHYPQWGWSDFIPKLIHLGIIVRDSKDPAFTPLRQQLYISKEISSITFTKDGDSVEVQINAK